MKRQLNSYVNNPIFLSIFRFLLQKSAFLSAALVIIVIAQKGVAQDQYLHIGYFDQTLIKNSPPRPPPPVSWSSSQKVESSYLISYSKNLFNYGIFQLNYQTILGRFEKNNQSQFAWTVFALPMQFSIAQNHDYKFYLQHCMGGLTLLQERYFNKDLGSHFTFTDYFGFGWQMSEMDISINLFHYSNGSLYSPNPGFDIPLLFKFGYRL